MNKPIGLNFIEIHSKLVNICINFDGEIGLKMA